METEILLRQSEVPVTSSYTDPDQYIPCPPSQILMIHFNIILLLRLGLPNGLFPSGFPTKTLYALILSPICATCPAHLILSIWSPEQYLVRSTDHYAPHYVVFSNLLSNLPS